MIKSATKRKVIAITPGDPAGVGPDLVVSLTKNRLNCDIVVICDANVLETRAKLLGSALFSSTASSCNESIRIHHIGCETIPIAGVPDPHNAHYIVKTLDAAINGCVSGEYDAMVTGPVNKAVISQAGYNFSGHTEYLAEKTESDCPVMLLASPSMRVALATTHLRLVDVCSAIDRQRLCAVIDVLHADLRRKFGFEPPRILVCGLNPHAGEGGLLGDEERTVIGPVIEEYRQKGLHIAGPAPADTAFVPASLSQFDAVLALYHDQGLPVIKHSCFGEIANVTLGLPIVRTSVDHGTAYDVAGTGQADSSSLAYAVETAINICQRGIG